MTIFYNAHDKPYIKVYRINNDMLENVSNNIVRSSSEHHCHIKDIIVGIESSMVIVEFQGQVWHSVTNGLNDLNNSKYTDFREKL